MPKGSKVLRYKYSCLNNCTIYLVIRKYVPDRYCLFLHFIVDRQIRRLIDFGWF